MKTYVAYYRVSTTRQSRSGLGIEAQRNSVSAFLRAARGNLLLEFTEVESGKRSDRTQLALALAACRARRATLVIAKLDRLARNVAFVSKLMEAGVEFVAADMPMANRLTIHILAAIAEHEASSISERTRGALQAAKARGTALGGFRGHSATDEARLRSRIVRAAKADQRAQDAMLVIEELRGQGRRSLRSLAAGLATQGVTAPRGGTWSAAQVRNLLVRLGAEPAQQRNARTS